MHGYASPSDIKEAPRLQSKQQARLSLFLLGLVAVLVLCLLLLGVPLLFFPSWENLALHPIYYGAVGAIALYALLFALVLRRRIPFLKGMEQKRQRALRGDSELLAEMQPFPNEHALDLPHTVMMRYKLNKLILFLFIFFLSISILLIISALLITNLSQPGSPDIIDIFVLVESFLSAFIAVSGILCIFAAIALIVLLARGKPQGYQVTLTSDGVIDARNRRVAWKDARLFAILNHGNRATQALYPLVFEVASADTQVRVMWLRTESARQAVVEPVVSYEEYERQMYSVLAVIAAKTGLPLYDLRKP